MKSFKVTIYILTADDEETPTDIKDDILSNLEDAFPVEISSIDVEETEIDHDRSSEADDQS
jgi:hypothetical protein